MDSKLAFLIFVDSIIVKFIFELLKLTPNKLELLNFTWDKSELSKYDPWRFESKIWEYEKSELENSAPKDLKFNIVEFEKFKKYNIRE